MKRFAWPQLALVVCLLSAVAAFSFATIPVRGSSQNGEDADAAFWNLFGPTEVRTLNKGTTTVNYKQQVVCTNQTVTNAVNQQDTLHSGTCEDGSYLFIYQLRSSATNVTVTLGKLVGFTANANTPTYGVMLCDSSTNTLELCTTATSSQLPNITFRSTSTTATFVIPNFPKFPNGTRHQGQGLTIFVITQQTAPNPVALPTIALQ